MKYSRPKIFFKDKRGSITDIFYKKNINHVAIIKSKKGALRGNHYHKKTIQYTFVLDGRIKYFYKNKSAKKVSQLVLKKGDLVKVSILVNNEPVDALAMIINREQAEIRGRAICLRLKNLIPRQLFKVALQAAIGGKVIARETISPMRKDVTAKCYGGDVSRKRKLLEKQKAGKKKMRQFGNVDIPQTAFFEALKISD